MSIREQIWQWLLTRPEGAYTTEIRDHFNLARQRYAQVVREMMAFDCVRREAGKKNANQVQMYVYFAKPENPPPGPGTWDHKKIKPRVQMIRVTTIDERKVQPYKSHVPHVRHNFTLTRAAIMPLVRFE